MSLTVKLSNGSTKQVPVNDFSVSVGKLKEVIADAVEIPAGEQRVVYKGKILKDDQVAAQCGLADGCAVHVVRSAAAAPSASVAAPPPTTVAQPAPQVQQPATTSATAPAPNPYAALFANPTGMPAGGAAMGGGWPGMAGMGAGNDQQAMQAMMANPQMMQAMGQMLAANPAMLDSLMQTHPMMQGMPPEQRAATMQLIVQMMQSGMLGPMMGQMGMGGGMPPMGMGMPPAGQSPGAPQGGMPAFNPFAAFGGASPQQLGAGGTPQAPGNALPPAQRYAAQLDQLRNMGFPNESANLAALEMTGGNVEFAISRLLGE
jgi:ubiquilin